MERKRGQWVNQRVGKAQEDCNSKHKVDGTHNNGVGLTQSRMQYCGNNDELSEQFCFHNMDLIWILLTMPIALA